MDSSLELGSEIWGFGRSNNVFRLMFEYSCERRTLLVHDDQAVSLNLFGDFVVLQGFHGLRFIVYGLGVGVQHMELPGLKV